MTRFQRLLVLASFLVTLLVLLAVVTLLGGLGVIELAICVIVAIPLSVAVNRVLVRRVQRRRTAG